MGGEALKRSFITLGGFLNVEVSVRTFYDKYCTVHGTESPETVSDAGCRQLAYSLGNWSRQFPPPLRSDLDTRSLHRIESFCSQCCGLHGDPSKATWNTHFTINLPSLSDIPFHCNNLYRRSTFVSLGWYATDQ